MVHVHNPPGWRLIVLFSLMGSILSKWIQFVDSSILVDLRPSYTIVQTPPILHPQAGSQVGSVVFEIPQSFQSVEVGSAHCQSALVIFSWKTRVLHSSFGITPQRSKAMGLWYFWLEPPMPCNLVHGLWRVLSSKLAIPSKNHERQFSKGSSRQETSSHLSR